MKISIVIPTYNEEKYIGKTLKSINELSVESDWVLEKLVIDANSSDKTVEVAKLHGAKVISVEHRGIGYARQQGFLAAKGEVVAFTDADTIVPPDWLKRHIEILQKENVSLSCGPFKVIDGEFPYYQYVNYIQFFGWWVLSSLLRLPFAAGQNMAFWRVKAEAIGGFNEKLLITEDTDFSMRMKRVGKVIFSKENIVYSSGRRSKEGWRFFTRMLKTIFEYFILRRRNMGIFPDFR